MLRRRLIHVGLVLSTLLCHQSAAVSDETSRIQTKAEKTVKAALEYEAAGKNDYRNIMLREARKLAPEFGPANWHSGRVKHDGRWTPVKEVQESLGEDEKRAQYRELRERAESDVGRQLTLARWCARTGFSERSDLHYAYLLMHPIATEKVRQEAMDKLDLQQVGGEFLTEQQIKQQQKTVKHVQNAMKKWRPRLASWRDTIQTDSGKKYEHAAREMQAVDDPFVIPVLETFLLESGERFGLLTIRLLRQFDQHEATQTIVRYATLSPWPKVRHAAIQQLKKRPMHDYLPMLLGGLSAPIQSQWNIRRDALGNISYEHFLYQEGQDANRTLSLSHLAVNMPIRIEGQSVQGARSSDPNVNSRLKYDGVGKVEETGEDRLVAMAALAQSMKREEQIKQYNAFVEMNNSRVFEALEQTTEVIAPRNPADWWSWWEQYNEMYAQKQTIQQYDQTVSFFAKYRGVDQYDFINTPKYVSPTPRKPRPFGLRKPQRATPTSFSLSCFVATTPVWTESGLVLIKDIKVGDRVLSQDPDSGELAFKLVLNKTLRPPAALARLQVEGEDITTTKGHPIWVANVGWRMAKLIEPGDQLHGIAGGLIVEEVEFPKKEKEAYNLVVDDFATYFVGEAGILVHDNNYRKPTRAVVPGLIAEDSEER